jgi:stage II sporulation protein D
VRVPRDPAAVEPIEQDDAPPQPGLEGRGAAVRIALVREAPRVTISGTGEWRIFDSGGESTLLRASPGALWTIEARRGRLRAVDEDGRASAERAAPFLARTATRGTFVVVNGKRYRGEVWVFPVGQGVTVVNRVSAEDYLRGVVPLEIGRRSSGEEAAVAAQAVAARSYTYAHLSNDPSRMYDMVATVMDQVYGGVDAEQPMSNAAVASTAGLVLKYRGVVVNAPYHSTCGGTTAAASEVWRSGDEPYLAAVSDRIPGTADRYYCDIAPRFRWTRSFTATEFRAALDRYLREYASVPSRGGVGRPESVAIEARTPTGRARMLAIKTEHGRYTLRGNDIRFVLRQPGGEILNSTYFSIETERAGGRGALTRVVVRGTGYGHGIGMCQWGAIGRARAGQDFRAILRTYYPGTTVAAMAE